MKIPNAIKKLSPKSKVQGIVTAFIFLLIFGAAGVYLLTGSHAATPLCPAQPAPLAACRPLLGAATYGNPGTPSSPLPASEVTNNDFQFSYLQGLVGSNFKFNIFRDYHCVYGGQACTAAQSSLTGTEKKYVSAGDSLNINWIPSPSWSAYPVSASSTGAGKTLYDEIVQAANSMKSIAPTPVYLTVWHEMNLHVTNSGVAGCAANGSNGIGTPAQFITAWQNVHDIFQAQGVTNVKWTMNYAGGSHSCLAPLMWPGDNYVNWVTWDTYSRGKTWDQGSGVFYHDLLTENGQKNADGQPADFTSKPWGIGEFGTCRQPSGGISEPAYFTSMQNAFKANTYPRLHMYVIYANNAEGNGSGCLTDYDTDPSNPGGNKGPYDQAKQSAVNSLLTTIASSGVSTAPIPTVTLSAPKAGSTVSGAVTVAANASVSSGSISSLVLKYGNTTLKTCSNATSCSTSWNTTNVANGSYTLAADATASGGGTNQQTFNVTVNNKVGSNCSLTAILVNPCRPLIGAAAHGNSGAPNDPASQFSYLEKLIGNQMDVYRDYHAPLTDTSNSNSSLPLDPNTKEGQAEIAMANNGKILDLNWDVTHTWKQALPVSAGGDPTINSQIDQAAANIKKLPHKVFLSPWHEANLHIGAADNASESCSHFNQSSPNGTPAQFVAAWQNIYNHFKADGVTNVVWVLNYGSYPPNDCWIPYMWPGNNDVDWVIVDTYSSYAHLNWDQSAGNFYTNVLKANSTASRNYDSKPWGIGEFGDCNAPDPQQAYDYFNSVTAAVKANTYPNYKMYLMYADTGNNAGPGCLSNYDPNGTLDQQKEQDVNAMFAAMLQGGSGNPAPTVSIVQPKSGTTVSGNAISVTATAGISSGSITNITLTAGGSTLASCSSSPCNTTWDTTSLSNGAASIEADVTASDGRMATAIETVTVKNPTPVTLTAPSYLVSPSQTTTSIALEWKASADTKYPASQLSYTVYRNGNKVGTTSPGVTNFTDTNLQAGTTYSYTVSATDPSGKSSAQSSPLTQATQQPPCTPPPAPAGFAGSATSPTSVKLAWQPVALTSNTCQIAFYVVERNGVVIAQPKTTSYTDASLTPGTTYTYTVAAELVGNIPGASSSVSVTTPKQPTDPGPTPPTDLEAFPFGYGEAILFWHPSTDPTSGIKDYQVLRNGKYRANTTYPAFGDTGLQPNTTYTYQVIAVSGNGKLAASKQVKVTTYSGCYPGWFRTLECRVPPGPPAY